MGEDRDTIALALSGGGIRAALWALGPLLQLEDAQAHTRVSDIASVSGGSITNGVVAASTDYKHASSNLRHHLQRLLTLSADEGLFMFGPASNWYARTLLTLAGVTLGLVCTLLLLPLFGLAVWIANLLDQSLFADGVVSLAALGLGLALGFEVIENLARKQAYKRDQPFRLIADSVGSVGVITFVVGLLKQNLALNVRWGVPILLSAIAIVLAVALWQFGRRSKVVETALQKELFADENQNPIQLTDLAERDTFHVFAATEIQSGIHAYLSPRFVYSYRFGRGQPIGLTVARAVQSSAALPGGFRPRRINTDAFNLQRIAPKSEPHAEPGDDMVLLDGGVYDNMGISWFTGLSSRRVSWVKANVPIEGMKNPGYLLVVNASAGWEWRPLTAKGIRSELPALTGVQSIMYKTTTRPRRSHLIREWQLLDRLEAAEAKVTGGRGAILNIDKSPWELAASLQGSNRYSARAQAALTALEDLQNRGGPTSDQWDTIAMSNALEPTVLRALGRESTRRLIFHSYILSAVATHIFADISLPAHLPLEDDLFEISGRELRLREPDWH